MVTATIKIMFHIICIIKMFKMKNLYIFTLNLYFLLEIIMIIHVIILIIVSYNVLYFKL